MLAIEMAGGVYCPLSPQDPQHRLQSLLEQTQSHFSSCSPLDEK